MWPDMQTRRRKRLLFRAGSWRDRRKLVKLAELAEACQICDCDSGRKLRTGDRTVRSSRRVAGWGEVSAMRYVRSERFPVA